MNWLAYNFAHDIELPGSSGPRVGFLMYPQAEVDGERPRIVSKARIRLDSYKSMRSFKGIICVDISEFESYSRTMCIAGTA